MTRPQPVQPVSIFRRFGFCTASLLVLLALTSCDSGGSDEPPTAPEPMALFLVDTCSDAAGETFRVLIRDPALIAEAERLIGAGNQRIVIGDVVAGDGGFNSPWSWHLDPDSVDIVDTTIEVCSGCASFVENDRDNWIATVGQYCPWGTVFLERQQ